MTSRQDLQKRRTWEERFEQFRASGLTVVQFCKQQHVSINAFYYWAKRVGFTAVPTPSPGKKNLSPARHRSAKAPAAAGSPSGVAAVRFSWNGVAVSVPANCLDAIRCLAECLPPLRSGPSEAFREVVVRC
jgi:hypothetical protein